MKRIIETDEKSGFEAVLGESITILSGVCHYTGTLSGVNEDYLELSDPRLIYETGQSQSIAWTDSDWKDAQPLPSPWRVMRQGIESWGPGK